MGAWGYSLYSNDATCDVRDSYIELLKKQNENEEAYKQMLESFQEYIGDDEEPLFWYALADTQWRTGRLIPDVKDRALDWIAKDGGLSIWLEDGSSGKGWKKTLQKLKEHLNSDPPPEKKFRKGADFTRNPWAVGDVYAYQFHTDYAKKLGLFGKYILMQKIGNADYFKWKYSTIRVFDELFTNLPDIEVINGLRILPLVSPRHDEYVPPFSYYLGALMIICKRKDYPEKYLTLIGNQAVTEADHASDSYSQCAWNNDFDRWLGELHLQWRDQNY